MKRSFGRKQAKGQPLRQPFGAVPRCSTVISSSRPVSPQKHFEFEDTELDDDNYSVTSTIANFDFEEEMQYGGKI